MSTNKALTVGFGLFFMGIAGNSSAAQDMPPPPPPSPVPMQSAEPSRNKPAVPPPAAAAPRGDTAKGTLQAKPPVPAKDGGAPDGIAKGEIRAQNGKAQPPAPIMHLDPSATPEHDPRRQSIKPAQ